MKFYYGAYIPLLSPHLEDAGGRHNPSVHKDRFGGLIMILLRTSKGDKE